MSTEQWKAAFKEIHGKTPTKGDYSSAPKLIREEYYSTVKESESSHEVAKTVIRSCGVRLKRPATDDQWSPIKKPFKRMKSTNETLPNEPTSVKRPVLRSSLFSMDKENAHFSPKKQVTFSPMKSVQLIPSVKSPSRLAQQSPSRVTQQSPSKRKLAIASPFRSLFDTPEKGENSILVNLTASQATTATPKSPRTPIRSPRKPFQRSSTFQKKNLDSLLLPTPEKKKPEEEVFEPFDTEEMASTSNDKKSDGPAAEVVDPETGKVIRRPFKQQFKSTYERPLRMKKDGENFVRINIKKKSFTRGKVTAEQKRKLKKKQNWKKRFGGAKY